MTSIRVDADGIIFTGDDETDLPGSLDVLFDGRRVCSVSPGRSRAIDDGGWRIPWIAGLRNHLHGQAVVTLREHLSGHIVYEQKVAFDDSPHRVAVVDAEGAPLAFDKWGQPGRSFEDTHPVRPRR